MGKFLLGSLTASILMCAVVGGLAFTGRIALVSQTSYEARSDAFAGVARCEAASFIGFGFRQTIVTGHVPLGGGSAATGGYVREAVFDIPGHPYDFQHEGWGRTSYYGHVSDDAQKIIAVACGAHKN